MTRTLSRRRFLALGAGAAGAAALSACTSPIASSLTGSAPANADVIFWHLFGGGDGANMTTMINAFTRSSRLSVEPTLLSWGNPYYTKLSLSASSGRPPDVAVAHLSRLSLLARAGLLEPLERAGVADVGITEDRFTPAAWTKATVDGTTYAVPLDTHPWVLYYNTELAGRAGLLDKNGSSLAPISGHTEFVAALRAMKQVTGGFGAVMSNTTDPATCWRLFAMLYAGLAGPIVADQGTSVRLDRAACEETFAFMQSLTGSARLLPATATPATTSTLFASGKAGFLFDGVWQLPTYRTIRLPDGRPLRFDIVPFPALLGSKAVAYADSHALVFPKAARSTRRTEDSARFVRGLLDASLVWAQGGHVPAWRPVQDSAQFHALKPQSNYVQAAFDAVYDPPGWYTGAGSDFQNAMGGVISQVLNGAARPRDAIGSVATSLRSFASALPPVR